MNKRFLILFLLIFLVCGCDTDNSSGNKEYKEKSKTYLVGEEKVIQEYVAPVPAYTTTELWGRTTAWGLKTRYEVGVGKDIEPGMYNIVASGWAEFNIFIGSVEIDLNYTKDYNGQVNLGPLERDVCYISERSCPYSYSGYKRVEKIFLNEGDILYTSYEPYSGQGVSIRFEPQYFELDHPAVEEVPEVKVSPLEVKETVRKYTDKYECYINDYKVPDCSSLNYYDELVSEFE